MDLQNIFEIILPANQSNDISGNCIVSICAKKEISDILFSKEFSTTLIRLKVTDNLSFLKIENLNNLIFADYVSKIKEIFNIKNIDKTIFIDFRVSKDIETDIQINYEKTISDKYIKPILLNYEYSSYSYNLNQGINLSLISEVSNVDLGLHAYQIIVSEKLFDINDLKCNGNIIFEEAIIYSDLSIKELISEKMK